MAGSSTAGPLGGTSVRGGLLDERIGIAIVAAVFLVSPALFCRRVALMKGLPPTRWLLAGLLFNVFAVHAVRAAGSRIFTCPECQAEFLAGQQKCEHCGKSLPDAHSMTTLVEPGIRFDGECHACGTPYLRNDYRPDALEIRCSRCGEVLEHR